MRLISLLPSEHLITGPDREPLDLDEVKKLLQYDADTDDTLIDVWIASARQEFEAQTGRQIMRATWENWLEDFPYNRWGSRSGLIELTRPPLQSVTSIQYIDTSGVLQTVDSTTYTVRAPSGPRAERGTIAPTVGTCWPQTQSGYGPGAVRIQFVAGYGNALGDVPELLRSALYLIVENFHCARCATDSKPFQAPPLGMDQIVKTYTSEPAFSMQAWSW